MLAVTGGFEGIYLSGEKEVLHVNYIAAVCTSLITGPHAGRKIRPHIVISICPQMQGLCSLDVLVIMNASCRREMDQQDHETCDASPITRTKKSIETFDMVEKRERGHLDCLTQ